MVSKKIFLKDKQSFGLSGHDFQYFIGKYQFSKQTKNRRGRVLRDIDLKKIRNNIYTTDNILCNFQKNW